MNIDPVILLKIKNHLRISHSKLDDDLEDTIAACLADLEVCGVYVPAIPGVELDPLLLNAVKLYSRKEFTEDPVKAAEYQKRYDALKSCLMMSSKYHLEESGDE